MKNLNEPHTFMTRKLLLLIVTLCPLIAISAAPFPAPYGLNWDMSDDNLKELGFTVTSIEKNYDVFGKRNFEGFSVFSSVSTPKPWSKGEKYLALTYEGRLVHVIVVSVDFTDDLYGSEGKKIYNQMKTLLTKKYGKSPVEVEATGRDIYHEADEFYECLEHSDCGLYLSLFAYPGGEAIALELHGKSQGVGYLTIQYTNSSQRADSFPEPFGLSWDMSDDNLKELGFTDVMSRDGFNIFSSVSAPKSWSKGEEYVAITYKDRLVKVIVDSIDFTNDIYGSEGKEMYNQMKTLLTKKYGNPSKNTEVMGMELYNEADEFYECLEYSGCGHYFSVFNYSGGTIGLRLNGKSRGIGYLRIQYESPGFSTAKQQIKEKAQESDAEAF